MSQGLQAIDASKLVKNQNFQGLKPSDLQPVTQNYQYVQHADYQMIKDQMNLMSSNSTSQPNFPLRSLISAQNDKMKPVDQRLRADMTREDLIRENEKLNQLVSQLRMENQRLREILDEEREMHQQVIQERNTFITQLAAEVEFLKSAISQDHQWVLNQEAQLIQKATEIEQKQEVLNVKENLLAAKEEALKRNLRAPGMASSEFDSDSSHNPISESNDSRTIHRHEQAIDDLLTHQASIRNKRREHSARKKKGIQQTKEFCTHSTKAPSLGIDMVVLNDSPQRQDISELNLEDDSESSSQRPAPKRGNLKVFREQQFEDSNIVSVDSSLSDRRSKRNQENNFVSDGENFKPEAEDFELID